LIANPIVKRELYGLLRRPQTLMVFTLLVAALAAVIVGLWPDDASVSLFGNQSQQLFRVFVYGLLVLVIIVFMPGGLWPRIIRLAGRRRDKGGDGRA